MKTPLSFPLPFLKLEILISLLFLTYSPWAQNPGVQGINFPGPQVFAHQTTEIVVTIDNQSAVPAMNTMVQVQVLDMASMQVFFFQTSIPLLPPGGVQMVSTLPEMWYPNPAGGYQIVVQVFGGPDQDPSNNMAAQPVNAIPQPPVAMRQVDMLSPYQIENSTFGIFSITFPPVVDPLFVNVMANDPNGSGINWIVRNLPLLPFAEPQTLSYWYDLRLLGFEEGDPVSALNFTMRLDPQTLGDPFPIPEFQPITVGDFDFDVNSDNPPENLQVPPPILSYPVFDFNPQLTWLYRGCTVPNIELDSSAHPPTPTYAGDWNACGPAAASNSIQWLEDTNPNIPDDGKTHREKMESLSGHMGRGNGEGVTTEQLVQGKLGYIDENKLPIHVKYQSVFITDSTLASPNGNYGHSAENKGSSTMNKPPTWEFLKSEMEKGEDVEIMFGWYDNMGNRHGGHWVTVTGVSENTEFKGIYIKQDGDQTNGTGTAQSYHNWVTDGDWSRLLGFDGPNNACWVESIVSESYDPSITFEVLDIKIELLQMNLVPWDPIVAVPDADKSFFEFGFPPSLDTRYMNVLANLPSGSPVWIARNVLLPPRDTIERVSLWLDLGDLGYIPGGPLDTIELQVGVGDVVWNSSFFDITYELPVLVDTVAYEVGIGSLENSPATVPFYLPPLQPIDSLVPTTYVYRGCEVPNIDLDSTLNNPVTCPGYAGDKNACGPAGAANSLQWLENTNPNVPANGQTHREKLKELSGMMNRANNGGVFRKDFVEAKLEFIDKYQLPIHVKFQGFYFNGDDIASPDPHYGHSADNQNASPFAKPQWEWLVQEMENGEDVEVEFGYYDENGVRQGGHWVTATGVEVVGGVRKLYFKDDTNQRKKGGMRHGCTEWVTHLPTGFSYLKDLGGSEYICVVESVVSESYDPTVTFCPDDLTLDQDPIPSGTYSASGAIYLSGKIAAGSNVTLSAPNITLLPTFELEQGATLTTDSTGCQ